MKIIERKTLNEVRSNIDLIDEKIIKLLAERSSYVSQAAKFKKTQSEVEAPNRVEEVVTRIKELSKQSDLNPDVGEKIFRTIISTFVDQETSILETNNTTKND